MKRLIIVGSPRSNGRSNHLAEMLFEACIDECPDDELSLAPLSELDIAPCNGCNACKLSEGHACVIDDDMAEIRELMDDADEVTVVSPVYFSGAPAQLKALLDRCQPYFWTWERGGERRPMTLHVIGEGLGPNGFDALISEVRAAGAVAGFALERVVDWTGKISESGEILAEGEEYVPAEKGVQFARIDADDIEDIHVAHEQNIRAARKAKKKERDAERAAANTAGGNAGEGRSAETPSAAPGAAQKRAQLNLYGNGKGSGKGNGGRGKGGSHPRGRRG